MREILFRGKRAVNDEWVEGYYVYDETEKTASIHYLNKHPCGWDLIPYYVLPETVGQYTGLCDKNGKKIFEGDILSHYINWLGRRVNGVCEYDDKEQAAWMCRFVDESGNEATGFLADWVDNNGCEIIGNIHDNPEMLKGGAE